MVYLSRNREINKRIIMVYLIYRRLCFMCNRGTINRQIFVKFLIYQVTIDRLEFSTLSSCVLILFNYSSVEPISQN